MNISSDSQLELLIEVYFDGLCRPINPGGIACYAFVVKSNGKTIHSEYGIAVEPFSNDATNNVAEYTALIKALEWLVANNHSSSKVRITGDSELIVNQQNGNSKVKSRRILPLFRQVHLLKDKFLEVDIRHVPREENREADRLTNLAYKEFLRNNSEYQDRIIESEIEKKTSRL